MDATQFLRVAIISTIRSTMNSLRVVYSSEIFFVMSLWSSCFFQSFEWMGYIALKATFFQRVWYHVSFQGVQKPVYIPLLIH